MTIIYKQLTIQNNLHHEFKVTTNCLNIDLITESKYKTVFHVQVNNRSYFTAQINRLAPVIIYTSFIKTIM